MSAAPKVASGETRRSLRDRLGDTPRRRRSDFARSRSVATMKYVLPGLAFGMLALVAVWPRLHPDTDRFNIDIAAVGPAGGSKPQVLNPRLQGIDSAKRPFQVTADLGLRGLDSMGSEVYDLTNPTADIVLRDGSWIALNANDGKFNPHRKSSTLPATSPSSTTRDTNSRRQPRRSTLRTAPHPATIRSPARGRSVSSTRTVSGYSIPATVSCSSARPR